MCRELRRTFLPVGITVEREIPTVWKIFRLGQNSSKSPASQTPGTRKNVNFENRRYGFSSYNCMSAELLVVFLPVGITVERQILTVRTIFRFGQNSSKSQADSGHKRNIVNFENRRSRALKAVSTIIPTCPGHFLPKSEADCGGQRPTKKNIGQILPSAGHC